MPTKSQLPYFFLGLATAVVFGLKLGYLPLIFEEPRRALVSLEMILSGNYVVPRINGFEYYNKPPLYNWILIRLFKLFGTSEWVVRLPTYLSLFAIAGINYRFFKSRIGQETALTSSFFFLLSGHVLFYFSFIGEIDITYSLIVYGQALVFLYFHDKEKLWVMFGWSYALMTIGFMTKGIPSIAFQGLTIIGFALYYRKWVYVIHPANFVFLTASLLCIFGYFQLYSTHSDPVPYFAQLINESSKRTSLNFSQVLISPFKVLLEFLKITFPWCLLGIPLLLRRNRQAHSNIWITYGMLFVIVNSWLYLLSPGTRDRYLYMFLPFIYNALAYYLVPVLSKNPGLFKKGTIGFSVLLSALFFYLSIDLGVPIMWPIFFTIGFIIVIIVYLKSKISAIMALFALMLVGRLAYDAIVFPNRKSNLKEVSAKDISNEIIREIGDDQLFFYTTLLSKENSVPILGSIVAPQIERLPYDLSFYVSRVTGKKVSATHELTKGKWYVSLKDKLDANQMVILEFRLKKKDWVLFKK
ncbi:MAG: hypothetical protein GY816_01465 [Cytophagales bacterium]|nr:hypothetical protein [Cytophagales bacterium]